MSNLSQYYGVNTLRPPLMSKDTNSPNKPALTSFDIQKKREISRGRTNLTENITQMKYEEIKKKYGSKERNSSELYQSSALQEITLRHSNYSSILRSGGNNINSAEKSHDAKSNSFYDVTPPQPFALYQRSTSRQEIKQVSCRPYLNVQQTSTSPSYHIPASNRPRNSRLDTSYVAKSIQGFNPESSRKEKDQRVGSIDKINMKIYQILNCLNQSSERREIEKVNKTVEQTEDIKYTRGMSPSFPKAFEKPIQKQQSTHMNVERISRKAQIALDRTRRYSVNSSFNGDSKILKKSITINNGENSRQREDSILKGRDIDQEIRRIQQRIKRTEEEKKKLNISTQQWSDVSIPRRLSSHSKASQKSSLLLERKNRLYNNMLKHCNTEQNEKFSVSVSKVDNIQRKNPSKVSPPVLGQSSRLNIPIFKQNPYEQISTSKITTNRAFKQTNAIKISIIYNEQPQPFIKPQTKKLIELLKNQVQLDEYLRNAKVLLSQIQQPTKYDTIQTLLNKKGINLSIEEIKKQLQLTPQEHNPFFSVRESTQTIDQLLNKYIESYLYWNNEVKGKFNLQKLKKENFTEDKIDLQKKGSLNVEDLVRFLNIETGNFYRNRDLILLFRRVTANQSTTFNELINILCFQ